MKNQTRLLFNKYASHIAAINGVPDATKQFVVEPTVEQKIEKRVQEQSDFLQKINVVPVDEVTGKKLGLGTTGPIASRTDTTVNERATSDIHDLTEDDYICKKTDFDSHIKYDTVDMWAKFPEFQALMRDKVIEQIARDRLMIGFNGTSSAVETNFGANPLLQDVNIGWLQHMRTKAAARVLSGTKVGTDAGNDYSNIDAAVFDAIGGMLDPWHRNGTDLVVICGSNLLHDKYLSLVGSSDAPTERGALQTLMSNKQLASRPTMTVPFFPEDAVMVTPLSNLSIYWQEGSRRRTITDNAKRDRIEDYQSVNEAYVVEDLGACCVLEGILTWDGVAWS